MPFNLEYKSHRKICEEIWLLWFEPWSKEIPKK